MKRSYKKRNELINIFIEKNIKNILVISIIFLIGVLIGIAVLNKLDTEHKDYYISYIQSFISNLKENNSVNETLFLINSIKYNIILFICLWFVGLSIIGIPFVYLLICYKGFCLGFSISAIILSLGIRKGYIVCTIIIIATKLSNNYLCNNSRGECNIISQIFIR